jgi:lysophospholipase L1-like esterase
MATLLFGFKALRIILGLYFFDSRPYKFFIRGPMRSAKTLMILALFCGKAFAFRTAVFGPELKSQTTSFEKQAAFFAAETPEDAKRPIWVLAGDSVATAFGGGSTLGERIAEAEAGELPSPGSGLDTPKFRPVADFTWYAGSKVSDNFLKQIESDTKKSWVVVAFALGGTKNTSAEHNVFDLLAKAKSPERVELITLSIGGNDLCDAGMSKTDYQNLERRIGLLKDRFKRAKFLVTKLPRLDQVFERTIKDLGALDGANPGNRRILQYCSDSWIKHNCPALKARESTFATEIDDYNAFLEVQFGSIVDLSKTASNELDAASLLAGDCFHPSRLAQPYIAKALIESFKQ